ncbi:MAG: hypothetical protein ACRC41_15140 [Sarcina sp.]
MKKQIIIVTIAAIFLGIIFGGIKTFEYVEGIKNVKTYKYDDMIMTTKVDPRIGGLIVEGKNSDVIVDYLNLLIHPNDGDLDLKLTYNNEPSINDINNLINTVSQNNKFYYGKSEQEVLTNIFTIIEDSPNQSENSDIIYKLINNHSNLTYMNESQIVKILNTTTLKGEQLKEITKLIIGLKSIYLNGFNASPV